MCVFFSSRSRKEKKHVYTNEMNSSSVVFCFFCHASLYALPLFYEASRRGALLCESSKKKGKKKVKDGVDVCLVWHSIKKKRIKALSLFFPHSSVCQTLRFYS